MKIENMVITTDDVMEFYLQNTNLLSNYNNMIYLYEFKEHFGKGSIERVIISSDIEIWVMNYLFNSDITMIYDMPENCFEIACCIDGKMEYYEKNINKVNYLSRGNVSLLAKKNASGYAKYLKDTVYKGVSIITNKEYVNSKLRGYSENTFFRWFNVSTYRLDKLYMGLPSTLKELRLIDEIMHCDLPNIPRLMYLEAKANEFIAIKFNDLQGSFQKSEDVCLSDYDIQRIDMAKNILIDNMVNPPSITELAKTVGLNSTKLKKGFKSIYNTTAFVFLRDTRLEYSKKLLFCGDMTIAEIANKVGYANPSKFSRAFRNKYGLNPKDVKGKGNKISKDG